MYEVTVGAEVLLEEDPLKYFADIRIIPHLDIPYTFALYRRLIDTPAFVV